MPVRIMDKIIEPPATLKPGVPAQAPTWFQNDIYEEVDIAEEPVAEDGDDESNGTLGFI